MALYWTSDARKRQPPAFACPTFPDLCTVAVIAGAWLYLFYGWMF